MQLRSGNLAVSGPAVSAKPRTGRQPSEQHHTHTTAPAVARCKAANDTTLVLTLCGITACHLTVDMRGYMLRNGYMPFNCMLMLQAAHGTAVQHDECKKINVHLWAYPSISPLGAFGGSGTGSVVQPCSLEAICTFGRRSRKLLFSAASW